MKNKNLRDYVPPTIKVQVVEMEECIAATSNVIINAPIQEEWTEEEIIFEKIEW